jgi:hypothetical protein
MTDKERFEVYSILARSTKEWVAVIDRKAGFMTALNFGLLAFLWTNVYEQGSATLVHGLAIIALISSLLSLFAAINTVIPRKIKFSEKKIKNGDHYKPFSYYGYVSDLDSQKFKEYLKELSELSYVDFATEALQQHFVNSHIIEKKSRWVWIAGNSLLLSVSALSIALVLK